MYNEWLVFVYRKNVSFSRYLDYWVFCRIHKCQICDFIINITLHVKGNGLKDKILNILRMLCFFHEIKHNLELCLTHCTLVLLFYTPWNRQKTFKFSVFRGYRKATLGCNGLKGNILRSYIFLAKVTFYSAFWLY